MSTRYKTRKNIRRKPSRKKPFSSRRKTSRRKFRGGTCYGSGIGANSYNPNFSIYNTRELQLFPYRT